MTDTRKIFRASIGPMPERLGDALPRVNVMYEDAKGEISSEDLFEFFPDEISFTESELVGLTKMEAFRLKAQKDEAWLRS